MNKTDHRKDAPIRKVLGRTISMLTIAGVVVVSLIAVWVWQVIIARTFFSTSIPDELADAAEIDGCSDIRFVMSVVLPLNVSHI